MVADDLGERMDAAHLGIPGVSKRVRQAGGVVGHCVRDRGVGLRASLDEGTALSFVVVATIALGALFIGWRLAVGWQRWRSRFRFLGR